MIEEMVKKYFEMRRFYGFFVFLLFLGSLLLNFFDVGVVSEAIIKQSPIVEKLSSVFFFLFCVFSIDCLLAMYFEKKRPTIQVAAMMSWITFLVLNYKFTETIQHGIYAYITLAYTFIIGLFVPMVIVFDLVMLLLNRRQQGA